MAEDPYDPVPRSLAHLQDMMICLKCVTYNDGTPSYCPRLDDFCPIKDEAHGTPEE